MSIDFTLFNPRQPDVEVIQLMEHIASGAKSECSVHADTHRMNGQSWRFDNYQDASDKFDELPSTSYPILLLYTRIGTVVRFRYKEPESVTP